MLRKNQVTRQSRDGGGNNNARYSLHFPPPLQDIDIQHKYNRATLTSPRIPSSAPNSPRRLVRRNRRPNFKSEIDFSTFIDTIDKDDYLRFDFGFFNDKEYYRIDPTKFSGNNKMNYDDQHSQGFCSPAERTLVNKEYEAISFQNEWKKNSYFAHIISDSIIGIHEKHPELNYNEKPTFTRVDLPLVQNELDVWFTAFNECVKDVSEKSKSKSIILHTIQRGLLNNCRKLLLSLSSADQSQTTSYSDSTSSITTNQSQNNSNNIKEENNDDIDDNESVASTMSKHNEKLAQKVKNLKKELNSLKIKNSDQNLIIFSLKSELKQSRNQLQNICEMNETLKKSFHNEMEKTNQKTKNDQKENNLNLDLNFNLNSTVSVPMETQKIWNEVSAFCKMVLNQDINGIFSLKYEKIDEQENLPSDEFITQISSTFPDNPDELFSLLSQNLHQAISSHE